MSKVPHLSARNANSTSESLEFSFEYLSQAILAPSQQLDNHRYNAHNKFYGIPYHLLAHQL